MTLAQLPSAPRPRHATNYDTKWPLFSLECLDPGSGRKIPAIWHGTGAYTGVFIPETEYSKRDKSTYNLILSVEAFSKTRLVSLYFGEGSR